MVNSYRNTISEWAVVVRYENFFIPRVKKSSKISPWEKNLASRGPTALGLIFEDFSTPWDEEISIPEKRLIRKSYISRPLFTIIFRPKIVVLDTDFILRVKTMYESVK